jgi:signal transduction histidine kinase
MQPAGSAPLPAENALLDAAALIQHLTHELRQPLSGIESAAYYLDMVVSEARPDLSPHCRRLRAMVQHANWLLDDAMLCAMLQPGSRRRCSLAETLRELSRRMLAEEEAVLDLHLESEGGVEAPDGLARLMAHAVAFFRDVAGCHDPIHAGVAGGPGGTAATIWADGCEDARDAARMLRAAAACGYLGRWLAAAGGAFEVEAEESAQRLMLTLRLPAAEQGQ